MSFAARKNPDPARRPTGDSTTASAPAPSPRELQLEQMVGEVLAEMADAWQAGDHAGAETWLARNPQLAADPEVAARIVYEEICQREERGEQVDSAEFYRRFPQWKPALEIVLDCHRLVEVDQVKSKFPEVGQRLGELELLRDLGRGAVGRVYLAMQPSLSDRLLVVKLSPLGSDEHLSLARLQHTHIAPLYLVQEFAEENLLALCMPYLGGTSWAELLKLLEDMPPAQRAGRQIVDRLAAYKSEQSAAVAGSPALGFLRRAEYVEAICWIGSCLADALHYAHQRGLMHLDLKPSNVLITGDGQPMLLDFHLARELLPAGSGPLDRLGGTPGYMAPEHELATVAVRAGRKLPAALDGRCDIYSLGVLLYESLCGERPNRDESQSRRTLRRVAGNVGRGLEDVLHKCLASDPAHRYADAGQLAVDLRRHLAALPLRGVPNRNLVERLRKWHRRRPGAALLVAAGVAALFIVATVGSFVHGERVRDARQALRLAQESNDNHDYSLAIDRAQNGWDALRWFPWHYDLRQSLKNQLVEAQGAHLATVLHEAVEQLRFVDSFPDVSSARLIDVESSCRRLWQMRAQLVQLVDKASSVEVRERVEVDLADLGLLGARLQVRIAPAAELQAARQRALQVLDEAETLFGKSLGLTLARQEIGSVDKPGSPPDVVDAARLPQSSWEHYAVGRVLFQMGRLDEARGHFDEAVRLQPSAFWPNFLLSECAYRQQRFDEALAASYACVALSPKSPECFYNRALCHQALGHHEQALGDFARAMHLDSKLAIAPLHRGMLLNELHRPTDALSDLQTALALGAQPAVTYYQMAISHLARSEHEAALACVSNSLREQPNYAPAQALKNRLAAER